MTLHLVLHGAGLIENNKGEGKTLFTISHSEKLDMPQSLGLNSIYAIDCNIIYHRNQLRQWNNQFEKLDASGGSVLSLGEVYKSYLMWLEWVD